MKQRTENEGRKLVAAYTASGKSQRRYAADAGISFSVLQYWIRRVRKKDSPAVANRFVEIEVPEIEAGDALRVRWGNFQLSFSRLPEPRWLNAFLNLFSA